MPSLGPALLASAPAATQTTRFHPDCPVYSACYQSYLQGKQWTFDEWRHISPGMRTIEILGTVSHPEQAVASCRGVLAAANNSGNAPADPHTFLGGCWDFVLGRWEDVWQITDWDAMEAMMHR